jgi:two-component system sensor histidine kinase RegB
MPFDAPMQESGKQPNASIWTASGRVRLRTLVLLRWAAIAGQTSAVLLVEFGLGFDLNLAATLGLIAISAWVNVFLMVARPSQGLVREWEAAAQLAYDVLQLAALLAFTGGVQNPFMILFIAPVAVAAATLRPAVTAALAGFAVACVAALTVWHAPLPWSEPGGFSLPGTYQLGLVSAVMIGLAFTSIYAWRVAAEEERLNVALAAVQTVLAREQRVSALGGLAAAAAHELGTPLATIHLVAKEMARDAPSGSQVAEDAALLVSQAERCRQILKQLSMRPEEGDAMHERLPVRALLEEAAGPHTGVGPAVRIAVRDAGGQDIGPGPELLRMPEIIHGLGNLVENAVGFADEAVDVVAQVGAYQLTVTVRDDGPGFPASVLPRLGEPYVSERMPGETAGGMGLGFFIAKTLLERTGARLQFGNRPPPESGAVIRAVWTLSAIKAPPLPGAKN